MELTDSFRNWQDQVEFPKGALIFQKGDPADFLYVVLEGEVEIRVGSEPLAAEIAGGIFGEMALVEATRAAEAVALRPTRLARFNREQFKAMVAEDPEIAIHLIAVIANRLQVAIALCRL